MFFKNILKKWRPLFKLLNISSNGMKQHGVSTSKLEIIPPRVPKFNKQIKEHRFTA